MMVVRVQLDPDIVFMVIVNVARVVDVTRVSAAGVGVVVVRAGVAVVVVAVVAVVSGVVVVVAEAIIVLSVTRFKCCFYL